MTALLLNAGSAMARRVAGPTMPSASRSLRFWKRLTARAVAAPNLPSAFRRSLRCTAATALPRSPFLSTISVLMAPVVEAVSACAAAGITSTQASASDEYGYASTAGQNRRQDFFNSSFLCAYGVS